MKKKITRISRKDQRQIRDAIESALMKDFFKRLPKLVSERKRQAIKALKGLSVLVLFLGFMGCDSSPNNPPALPACAASVVAETCVDHTDVAICLVDSAPVTGCVVPSGIDQGVTCVQTCPPNRYDTPTSVGTYYHEGMSWEFNNGLACQPGDILTISNAPDSTIDGSYDVTAVYPLQDGVTEVTTSEGPPYYMDLGNASASCSPNPVH